MQKRVTSGVTAAPTPIYGWRGEGWLRIQLVARQTGQFSRPPYFTAGVNLTAESAIEPPRGGELGAGVNCLNKKRSFAESRNEYRL